MSDTKARAHRGLWLADCVCRSATLLLRHQSGFRCAECGRPNDVEWPPESMVYGIERLLLMRPDVLNQNWNPDETLHDLAVENAEHGIWDGLPAGADVLVLEPDRVRTDTLPITKRREFLAITE